MNTKHITSLLGLGQLSLDLHAADEAVRRAKDAYHAAWRLFENYGGEPDEWEPVIRITRGHPLWDEAIADTAPAYRAYQAAKKAAHAVKRRWVTACARAAKECIHGQS